MKRRITFVAVLAIAATTLFSCGGVAGKKTIDGVEVASIGLVNSTGVRGAAFSDDDTRAFARLLSDAVYDTLLNDSGIMIKMVEPDYTLAVSYVPEEMSEDLVQIWAETGRTLFRTKWWNLREEDLPEAVEILKRYPKE